MFLSYIFLPPLIIDRRLLLFCLPDLCLAIIHSSSIFFSSISTQMAHIISMALSPFYPGSPTKNPFLFCPHIVHFPPLHFFIPAKLPFLSFLYFTSFLHSLSVLFLQFYLSNPDPLLLFSCSLILSHHFPPLISQSSSHYSFSSLNYSPAIILFSSLFSFSSLVPYFIFSCICILLFIPLSLSVYDPFLI